MIRRGLLTKIKDVICQVTECGDEVFEDEEMLTVYGFEGRPKTGAEAIVCGDLIIGFQDRQFRIKGLKDGEVAIYTDEKDSIILKRGNKIEVKTKTFEVTCEKCAIKNSGGELISLISDALKSILNSKTATFNGPQPLIAASTELPTIQSKVEGFKC